MSTRTVRGIVNVAALDCLIVNLSFSILSCYLALLVKGSCLVVQRLVFGSVFAKTSYFFKRRFWVIVLFLEANQMVVRGFGCHEWKALDQGSSTS